MIFARKSGLFSRLRIPGLALIAVSALIGSCSVGFAQTNSPPPAVPADWQVSLDEGQSWRSIQVPGTIEDQQDAQFDGVVTYRTSFQAAAKDGHRVWLRFQAVATEATVWLNGQQLGTHLGGWTPFEFDITGRLDEQHRDYELVVQVDEKVGHNTQGFLPIIAPHFGGIWKPVVIEYRPLACIDRDSVHVLADVSSRALQLTVPIKSQPDLTLSVEARYRAPEQEWTAWQTLQPDTDKTTYSGSLPVNSMQLWSPVTPALYQVQARLRHEQGQDLVSTATGFRTFRVDEDRFLLNDHPTNIRGLLNWGYAPPSVAPTLDGDAMRQEILFAKQRGFNLMKFCLWIPPKKYLELCDELGMLAWVEYPTWHPDFSEKHLADLRREYTEFFHYDRNHPAVVLRSLTCETGPGADINVIRSLYDLCKQEVPGAIVEDDSSWIQWNRVHDFYDDHPYGNNHTWSATIARLQNYIQENGVQPLVLGEAIAADTWVDPNSIPGSIRSLAADQRPFHVPMFLDANAKWWQNMESLGADLDDYSSRTRRYAMRMRKFQIETFRKQAPRSSYVVSVIRDFRKAAMGLIDYSGQPKWTPNDWSFQQDHSLSLATGVQRGFQPQQGKLTLPVVHSSVATESADFELRASLTVAGKAWHAAAKPISSPAHGSSEPQSITFTGIPPVESPTPATLIVRANASETDGGAAAAAENQWSIWLFPEPTDGAPISVRLDPSLSIELDQQQRRGLKIATDSSPAITLATRLTPELLERMNLGQSVILLADPAVASPEDSHQRGRFPVSNHWFLRGGPVVVPQAGLTLPTELLMDLQHFDLAGPVVSDISAMLDSIQPHLLLWDNHDMDQMKTHGLLFSVPVGKGSLMVSTLNHLGTDNPAGQWLLRQMLQSVAARTPQSNELSERNLLRFRRELNRAELELQGEQWAFQPDKNQQGEQAGWQQADFDDSDWSSITCNQHWESQGFDGLDGWAWYRLQVTPQQWSAQNKTYLNFTGVDDHYRLWVNGNFVGQDGEIETKATAFDRRKSYDITQFVKPDQPITIAIAVYDWYGAGGIFRPVTLSTEPLAEEKPWLK